MMQFKGLALNHKSTVLILRWLVVLLVIFMAAYSPKGLEFNSPNYLLSLIYLVLNLAISFIPQRYFEKGWFVYVLFVLDIIFVSAVVYFAEGINTDFYLIYFLSIFMSSVGQSLGGAFPVAIVTSLLYGWLVYKKYGADMFGEPSFWLRIPFFFLIAIFSSFWSVQVAAERKKKEQAEEALKYAALNWNTTFDAISDIVCVISSGHEFLSINNAGVKALGLPREQIIGRKCYELVHRTTEPIIACPCIMTLESGVEGFSEYEQDDRYYSLHAWPIKDPDGRTVSFVHIIKDITDRKRAEEALWESEERLRSFADNTFIGIYRTTPGGRILMSNPALVSMLGYASFEDLARRNLEQEDYAPSYERAVFKRLVEQGDQLIGYESLWKRNDGSAIWMRENARCIRGPDREVLFYEGTVEDITEHKRAEDALKESEERYRALFQKAGDAIIIMEAEGPNAGKIAAANQAAAAMHGYKVEEISRLHISDLDSPSEHHKTAQRMERILKGEWIKGEIIHRRKDGTEFPVEYNAGLLEYGGRKYILAFDRDISDRKLMEQELLQAQKMDAIGHLAGGVAHDFNNMLAGIVGNAELLQLKVYGQKELESYVDNIIKASGHAATLTKQLLAFARKGQYQKAPVNVHKIIAETLGILSSTIDRRISIEQHLRANPAVILGDPGQLENALMNLGINARDAMPEGGKLIFSADLINLDEEYIRRHNYKIEPGPYIQISVDDTGSGMSGEVKRHLFEPFFTTKEKGLGTGLGLAGVYGCVKNHGGSIEVYSELGRGTSVKLYLPLYGGLPAGQQDFGQPQALPDLAGTGSILIVDDEEMIRSIAAQILKIAGYQVQTCADGQEAVELYSRQHQNIDLVIMDMVMPRLDGREAFAQMRKINPKVKVLLSSGFSEDGDAQAILQDGALGFIQKPYHSAELLLRVQQALQRTTNN